MPLVTIDKFTRLLLAPPATGWKALSYAVVLVAVPTAVRLALSPFIDRLPFFPYIPFVILAAILLDWKYAAAEAFASWLVADFLFMEPLYRLGFGPYQLTGFAIFLLSAALVIGLSEAARRVVENSLRPIRHDGIPSTVVFSLEGGQAWVSWYGSHSWVRLGPEKEVADMMRDFLAQLELGQRLNRPPVSPKSS
jgi:hypothetical protein